MKLLEVKQILRDSETISFRLPDGSFVPSHFHVTEIGKVTKDFIDCGGKRRKEEVVNFQLWEANDYDHRLHPEKLLKIILKSEEILGLSDQDIEVEYQGETIGKFSLGCSEGGFQLLAQKTACLAKEECLVPLSDMMDKNTCAPGSGCC